MDQTHMQQTVKESVEYGVSNPQETDISTKQPEITNNDERAYEPLSYDVLFPELPNARNKAEVVTPSEANIDMRITSSTITHMFNVPFEERAKIDGNNQFGEKASSRICADITAKTGAHIEISTARDQSLTFLITGKNEEVLRAKKFTLEKFQTQARQSIKIPKEHHRFILGKKGKKLQELEAMTGTKIHVPNANDPSMDIIILGTRDSIEKAYHEIQLVSDEQSKQAYEKLDVPKMYHPFINTVTSQKLNQLLSEKSVRINLPPPSISKNEITIAGEKEGEKKCQTVSVEVKKSQHKYVVGPRGANITDILHATNVSVEMPPSDSPSETITLRGPQEKLGTALTLVYEKASSVVTENVKAPSWLHKFIIGRKGSSIRNITQDLPKVHVEFTDKEGGIKLEGPPDEVQIAHDKLEIMIADLKARLNYEELAIDPQFYKHIIGKNGSNINRIRNEFEVLINISEIDGKNLIRLEGNRDGVAQAKNELEELVKKIENEKERVINIENRFHRNIIGTKGDKIKEIRERFNQVQISFPDQGEKSDAVKIRGPKEDVDQCYKYLQKMKKELVESNFQLKVSIFRQFHKYIIGKAGSNINKIREETNTKIELPSEGQNSDDIIITGKKENCEKARERIQKIQNELANIIEVDILIPGKFHNAMIGAGGKLIQSISEECGGVSIKFPPPDSKSDKVTIRGPKDDVAKAKRMLIDLSNEKQLSSFVAEVRAKPELHRFLIGRNGANVRKIRDKTGARIIFPNDKDQNKELITIIGKKESVEKAQAELKSIISDLDKVVEEVITVDPKYHRHFVARRGDVLKQISEQYGEVTISFPRQGVPSDKVTIKGIKECVDGAKNRVLEIVEDLKLMVTLEVNIPQKHHRNVMGPRGIKVQNITSDYDVQIKFPDKDFQSDGHYQNGDISHRPQDIVIIQGKKDKCEAAKEALLALVPVSEEIDVPFKYHRFIIGQKGESVPPADEQKDSIIITGPRSNVDSAKSTILAKVDEYLKEEEDKKLKSFQLQLRIDPEYHPRIIGKKGSVITKIREKHDVNIQFPARGGSEEDLITITGYEKNCEGAKEAILAITGDLDNMVRKSVVIDSRIHSRLIGARGRSIRKIMEEFKVEIKFPREGDDPDEVIILGLEDNVEDCLDHILNLAEEYIQDLTDEEEARKYIHSSSTNGTQNDSSANSGSNSEKCGCSIS
ncbi:Vigilin [Armadillidium vulgare]|nr:Vigilin [Armadillidium vulgare]